jgi:uncharacterized protein YkwD
MEDNVRHRLPRLFPIALCTALVADGLFLAGVPPAAAATTSADSSGVETLVRQINAVRRKEHLRLLRLDARLCAIARSHAIDMLERNFVGHTNPDGLDAFARMARANYSFGYAGENLAVDESLDSVNADFFASPEHRENLLEPHYSRVGIGTVPSGEGEIVVEDFSD